MVLVAAPEKIYPGPKYNVGNDMSDEKNVVKIFVRGGCVEEGGPGIYGIVLTCGDACKELAGGLQLSTDRRMELYATCKALEALRTPRKVILKNDSEYLVKSMNKGWVKLWEKNNWWKNPDERAANSDHWKQILSLSKIHQIEFKLFNKNLDRKEFERCGELAYEVLNRPALLPLDPNYRYGRFFENAFWGQRCPKCGRLMVRLPPRKFSQAADLTYGYSSEAYCRNCKLNHIVKHSERGLCHTWDGKVVFF
jgi:ribonuclease HI